MHTRQDAAAPAQPQHNPATPGASQPESTETIAPAAALLDVLAQEHARNWAPLEKLCPPGLCEQFMFMGCEHGIYLYKHVDSRCYLNVDADGQTYVFNARTARYDRISVARAIQLLAPWVDEPIARYHSDRLGLVTIPENDRA